MEVKTSLSLRQEPCLSGSGVQPSPPTWSGSTIAEAGLQDPVGWGCLLGRLPPGCFRRQFHLLPQAPAGWVARSFSQTSISPVLYL